MENENLYRVKRLHPACCGMEEGKEYVAKLTPGLSYASVKLPDGTWTAEHWVGNGDAEFFEILGPVPSSGAEGSGL